MVEGIAREWQLDVGPPIEPGSGLSWVAPATTASGDSVILKVGWPHPEAEREAAALRLWDGDGSVRLLAHDVERWALLLESCEPGTALGVEWDDDTLETGASLMRRLWRPVDDGFPRLRDLTVAWAATDRERAARWPEILDAGIVEDGLTLLVELAASGESMLLHTDLHPGNVLAAEREPWLVIDPKPMIGDRCYDAFQLVIHGVADGRHLGARIARVADTLDLPRDRLRAWALARSVEWALWAGRNDPTTDWARAAADRARMVASSNRG